MDRRDIGGTVVGHEPLDPDPVAGVESGGATQEADRRRRLLIGQHLGVGEAAVVVDRDVHELPADRQPAAALEVDARGVVVLAQAVPDALAGAALEPAQPLDIDVHELARPRAFVPHGRLEPDPAEPADAAAAENHRHRRQRHPQRLGDLGGGEAQPAQRHDQLDPLAGRAVGDPPRRGRAIAQATLALQPVAPNPRTTTAHTDSGGRGRRRQSPPLKHNPLGHLPPAAPAERRVTVKLHPGPPSD